MLHTRLYDLLGIEVPIINAPMSGYAGGDLAGVAMAAGGLGLIGGTTGGGAEWLRADSAGAGGSPTAPSVSVSSPHFPGVDDLVAVQAERVPVIAYSFADLASILPPPAPPGARALPDAEWPAPRRGGGRRRYRRGDRGRRLPAPVATLPLVPAVRTGRRPVVAAGGIADGRGIAAALLLGYEGVWLGTRFALTRESAYPAQKKERLLAADVDATLLTAVHDIADEVDWPDGILGRSVRNAFSHRWHGREDELRAWIAARRPVHAQAQRRDDPDETSPTRASRPA
ncbi:MAG: nitronate monooxygenase [Dehalococcoidia bacterium]